MLSILLVAHLILAGLSILHLVLFSSRPIKAISWLLFIVVFPVVGVILYFIFGINRRKNTFLPLKQQRLRKAFDEKIDISNWKGEHRSNKIHKLSNLVEASCQFFKHDDTTVKIYNKGNILFDDMLKALEEAKEFVHIQYYLLEEGKLLERLLEVCKKLVEKNVQVIILYDAIGSYQLSNATIGKFKAAGVEISPILPLKWGTYLYTLNFRNHRKIVIVDGTMAFTGGMNFSDKYISDVDDLGIWKDMHLRLKGAIVKDLQVLFATEYYYATDGKSLFSSDYFKELKNTTNNTSTQLVSGSPADHHPNIMLQYVQMIYNAEETIFISNPYIIPNSPLIEALRNATLRGVEINLLIPKSSDTWIVKYCMFSFFEELLSWGIHIYLYDKTFIHKKVITIDGEICSIGSGNFDHRSFEHNFESNIIIYDKDLTQKVDSWFIEDGKLSKKLELVSYKKRPVSRKLKEGFARFFSPLL